MTWPQKSLLINFIGHHPSKNVSFNILSLADQLHQLKLVIPDGSDIGKIYFYENPVPDCLAQGLEAFEKNIILYNELVDQKKYRALATNGEQASDKEVQEFQASDLQEREGNNERVNEIFNIARESVFIAKNIQRRTH